MFEKGHILTKNKEINIKNKKNIKKLIKKRKMNKFMTKKRTKNV